MFSVSHFGCATGYYTFGHEIGHNFGMKHDRGYTNNCKSTGTYSFGFVNPNAEFRTILSYDCETGRCDKLPKNGCPRVQRFSSSNTSYTYFGKAIGNAINDNARQFNSQRALIAAYFPAMNCQNNTECNDNDSNTIDTCNTVSRVCVFTSGGNGVPMNAPIQSPTTTTNVPKLVPSPFFFPTNTPPVLITVEPTVSPRTGFDPPTTFLEFLLQLLAQLFSFFSGR
jgi:hypothetical protein